MITTPTVSGKPGQAPTGLSCDLYPLIGSQHLDRSSGVPSYANATPDEPTAENSLNLFFSGSQNSRAKGMEYLRRAHSRQADRDAPTDLATRDAQLAAITAWGIPDASKLNRLAGITQPVFIANGDNDTMMQTRNSYLLAERLPNAHIRIYPDANHGFLDQAPELFADHVREFLNAR